MLDRIVLGDGDIFWDVFLFKQKTAYEMRISDWSSDVCSSDLQHDNDVRTLWRVLDVCQHLIVVAVQELDAELCLQGWILVTNAIQPGDLGNDVARCLPVAWTQIVLFRVEVFLLARTRFAPADPEAAVQAPHPGPPPRPPKT